MNEVLLNLSEQGLQMECIDVSNTVMTVGFLDKNKFVTYESLGKVGILNMSTFHKVLKQYSGEVTITKNNNVMLITDGRTDFELVLPHSELIKESPKVSSLQYDTTFNIDSGVLKTFSKNSDILDKGLSININCKPKNVTLESGSDDKCRVSIIVNELNDNITVKFGIPLRNVISVLDGTVSLSLKNEYPAKVLMKNENYTVTYIVAPMSG